MTPKAQILDLFRARRAPLLDQASDTFIRAQMDGDSDAASAATAMRRELLDWPATLDSIAADDRAALVQAWPASVGTLPLYLSDPEAAAAADPAGPACVLDLGGDVPAPQDAPAPVDPGLEAAILARRQEKAREEDRIRFAGTDDPVLDLGREAVPGDIGL